MSGSFLNKFNSKMHHLRRRTIRAKALFWTLMFLAFVSCTKHAHRNSSSVSENKPGQSLDSLGTNWVNPILEHRLSPREVPFRSFPFDTGLSDDERIDSLGFTDFIQRMNASFSESGLSVGEANLIYSILQKSDLLKGSATAPNIISPANSSDLMSMDMVRERAAIKRISDDSTIGIFYKIHDCGWNYSHTEIEISLNDSLITHKEKIESWVARTPC